MIEKLRQHDGPIGFDIETGYVGPNRAKGSLDTTWEAQFIVGFSITSAQSWARYVPLGHDFGANLDPEVVWPLMKPLLEEGKIVAHNMKFEKRNLRKVGIEINVHSDSMIEAYVLSNHPSFGLKALVKYEFNHEMAEITSLFPGLTAKALTALRFNILELSPEVVAYACEDAAWCLALHERFFPMVTLQRKFMYGLEMSVMEVMCDVEDTGMPVAWDEMEAHRQLAAGFIQRMERAVKAEFSVMAGGKDLSTLNLGSPKQMQELLYRELGLSTTKMTKGGEDKAEAWQGMSTGKDAMETLSKKYPAIQKLLEFRQTQNLANRLKKWLDEHHFSADGRVHANYNQVVVGTGRFAANDPAIQQCPKEWRWATADGDVWNDETWAHLAVGENGKDYWQGNFRDFLVAPPDSYLLTYDYCLGPDTRVLTSDLHWKALRDVQVGDTLVGFDEEIERGRGKNSKMREAVVERKREVCLPSYLLTLEDGTEIVASDDHYWVATDTKAYRGVHRPWGKASGVRRQWFKTSELTPDHVLHRWVDPWESAEGLSVEDQRDLAYLAGFADGEGWITANVVALGQLPGTVWEHVKTLLARQGFPVTETTATSSGTERLFLRGGNASLRFLGQARPLRLLENGAKKGVWEGRSTYSRKDGSGRTRIVRMERYEQPQDLIAIRTSTGTFVAEGLLTHNSQIELRVLAGESKEPSLLDAFANDRDVHTLTAAIMLGKTTAEVTTRDRQIGKTTNFALLYGQGPKSLGEQLGVSMSQAKELYQAYFSGFTSVTTWMERVKNIGKQNGYAETHFGRKYKVWELESSNQAIYSKGERVLVNAPIQGGAADYMKIAMVRVARDLKAKGWWKNGCTIVMNQHDSLTFIVSNELNPVEVRELIEAAVVFHVAGFPKIVADWEVGQRWGSSTKWKDGMTARWVGTGQIGTRFSGTWQLVKDSAPSPNIEPEMLGPTEPVPSSPEPVPVVVISEVVESAESIRTLPIDCKRVIVEIDAMPTTGTYTRFLDLLAAKPGPNRLILRTPDGDIAFDGGTSLCESDQGLISLTLGGARVYLPPESVNLFDLTEGLSL